MEERTTHNLSEVLVNIANGEPDLSLLVRIRQETAGMDLFINPSSGDKAVLRILAVVAAFVLDQAIGGAVNIIYCEQVSFLGFHKEQGSLSPLRFGSSGTFNPLAPVGLEKANDVQVAMRMFGALIEGGRLDPERVGKCHCGRYFLSARLGARKSRACSKAHQAILMSRELRSSPEYREREKQRNARRMAAVREAEKIIAAWKREGKSPGEVQNLLWDWNKGKGGILGKRSLYSILEKGV
ncbi:hypothetical protein [Leptospirillum ferriphilum]|uniref:hypothetical protein n=1 Tax=Leptospirillum ferriphilum TaxID=178606 RepID=UPI0005A0B7A1|nr:hypothetical protein [Leptospirillum ferriphilum]OOH77758.1 hypothetical protein BOX30_09250 [Leptospirillum ferriphilum]